MYNSYYGLTFNPFDKQQLREKDHFISRDFTEMTPFFEEFRRIVFTRFGDYPMNDIFKVYRNFPTSVSYLLNVVAKYEFRRDREALKGLSEINRHFPYHQVRINKKEAGLGFLHI